MKILCLSPHPDDAEISFSGTTKKFSNVQFDIYTFSIGNENEGRLSGEFRIKECLRFWETFNSQNINLLTSEIKYITELDEGSWIKKIEETLDITSYDVVLIPPKLDNHFEHRIVNGIGRALSRNHCMSVIEYQTPSTKSEWKPNSYVVLDQDIFEQKCQSLLSSFEKQVLNGRVYFKKDYIRIFSQDHTCFRKGASFVEKFKILETYLWIF